MPDLELWPPLPLREWQDTYRTLHMWTQIAGKIRMALAPPLNHWWHVTLYVNSHGLTTGPVPYAAGLFEVQFDFQQHQLRIWTSWGVGVSRPLQPESVAAFYAGTFECLASLGIAVTINLAPQEVGDRVPFDQDSAHCFYDAQYAQRFWRILVSSAIVLERFRAKFIGKCSPVHFFWGGFDLACTRFSGRVAPRRPGVISGPAYSHEVSSCGFWPGNGGYGRAAFFVYAYPEPQGYGDTRLSMSEGFYDKNVGQFILPYDAVRAARDPDALLATFLQETYAAAANLAKWDRKALERA